ncbi:hypothetical protein SALBM135S_08607 [Streptomyces alboniger]
MNSYQHVVYWHDTEPVTVGAPLREDIDCDVCIVGGGFTGLWTAYFLKEAEPALDIRVIEANHSGYGASGRADGFVTPTIGKDIQALVREFGYARALEASQAVGRSILEIGRFARRNRVDAEYEANDYLMVATDEAQLKRLREDRDLAERMGAAQAEVLPGEESREIIGSPAVIGSMRTGGALVNPYKLARGIARVVREKGVTLYDDSPCLRVEPGTRPTVVTAWAGCGPTRSSSPPTSTWTPSPPLPQEGRTDLDARDGERAPHRSAARPRGLGGARGPGRGQVAADLRALHP